MRTGDIPHDRAADQADDADRSRFRLLERLGFEYPKVQILTLDDFFANKLPKLPSQNVTFASAKFKGKGVKQEGLGL